MLIKNIRTFTLEPPVLKKTDLRIDGAEIVAEGPALEPLPGETVADLGGKLVLPGFVNAHTHLYSSLSRGMPAPEKAPADFTEVLEKIWWKLDVALDEETIYYSALAGAIDAIRCGTTTIIDHHASPSSIKGSLDILKKALSESGLRGVLCYEVTDRGGRKKRDEGLEENARFIEGNRTDDFFRGYVGAHAAFTLSDESLRLLGGMAAELGTGVHIHALEDVCDAEHSQKMYGRTVIDRLEAHRVLVPGSILAHCVHLTPAESEIVRRNGCWIVHNPRSNMNNRVGYAQLDLFGKRAALGTDGFPSDMLEEAKFAFYKRMDSRAAGSVDLAGLVAGGQRLISRIFGREFGTLREGSVADIVVLDYVEPTPIGAANLLGHYLFGLRSSMVESVMVGGKWVMKDRRIEGLDENRILARSRQLADKLWKKIEEV